MYCFYAIKHKKTGRVQPNAAVLAHVTKCLRMRARELMREIRAEPPTLATCALTPVPVMRAPITILKRRTSARVCVSLLCSLKFSLVDCLVSLPQLVSVQIDLYVLRFVWQQLEWRFVFSIFC